MNRLIIGLALAATILPLKAQDTATLTPGLPGIFFNGADFSRPDNTGIAAQINLDTGATISDYSHFSTGYLKAPASGEITIIAEADNGLRLALQEKLVINGWGEGTAREGKITATEGDYLPLQLEYFQDNGGPAFCRLYWKWEGREKELIPVSAYFHDQKDKGWCCHNDLNYLTLKWAVAGLRRILGRTFDFPV
jgi:hypothetical protein